MTKELLLKEFKARLEAEFPNLEDRQLVAGFLASEFDDLAGELDDEIQSEEQYGEDDDGTGDNFEE